MSRSASPIRPLAGWWQKLSANLLVDPPRSWPDGNRQRFKSLPYDLQVYVAAHEAQREKALRRAQNEAANAR